MPIKKRVTSLLRKTLKMTVTKKTRDLEIFGGGGELFRKALSQARVYGEYGVGDSTLWVDRNSNAEILAVETDRTWAEKISNQIENDSAQILHIDLGEVGDWGRPLGYKHRTHFDDYFTAIWRQTLKPDVVLIDGRFRVACFLTSWLLSEPGTLIVFDDYVERRFYHIVEEVTQPLMADGRQALFRVEANSTRREDAILLIEQFRHCMD